MSICLLFLVLIISLSSSQSVFYRLSYEHSNQTTAFNDSVELNNAGYKSHYDSLSSITSGTILCYGAYSCSKAGSISTLLLECASDSSCSKVSNIQMHYLNQSQSYIDIAGVNGLIYSTVSHAAQLDIFCRGEQSCAHSTISAVRFIHATGAYSLLNATVDSVNGTANVSIDFRGYYAGFNTMITCRTGQICTMQCHSSGCSNIHLNCNDNNCIIRGTMNRILTLQDVLLYDSYTISQQNDALCSAQIDINMTFDDNLERHNRGDVLDNLYGGPICCRGYQSCTGNTIHYTSHMNESIVCGSQFSCSANSDIFNNGAVFCTARWSCSNSKVITTGAMYCNAYYACAKAFISKSPRIYCTAQYACMRIKITSDGTDLSLYLSGHGAGTEANITCSASDDCSIFCYGYNSCHSLRLWCDGTCTVHCDADSECPIGWTATPTTAVPTTANPTQDPTIEPSLYPSAIPTAITTAIPTVPIRTTGTLAIPNTTILTTESRLIAPLRTTSSGTVKETNSSSRAKPEEPEDVAYESKSKTLVIIIALSSVVCLVIVMLSGVLIHQLRIILRQTQNKPGSGQSGVVQQKEVVHISCNTKEVVEKNYAKTKEKAPVMVLNVVSHVVEISIESKENDSTDTVGGNHVVEEGAEDIQDSLENENVIWAKETSGFIAGTGSDAKQLDVEPHLQSADAQDRMENFKRQNTKGDDDAKIADDEFVIKGDESSESDSDDLYENHGNSGNETTKAPMKLAPGIEDCKVDDAHDRVDGFKRQNTRGEEAENVADDEFVINEDTPQ